MQYQDGTYIDTNERYRADEVSRATGLGRDTIARYVDIVFGYISGEDYKGIMTGKIRISEEDKRADWDKTNE